MVSKVAYKWCFVPKCTNTTISTPNKVFVTVPRTDPRRKQWFQAARRDVTQSKSIYFCCEDHFKLEDDIENYIRYKLMGGLIKMKNNVVPHIFDCQQDRKRTGTSLVRPVAVKRLRKDLIQQAHAELNEVQVSPSITTQPTSVSDFSSENIDCGHEVEDTNKISTSIAAVQVKMRRYQRSKYVSCNIVVPRVKAETKSIGIQVNTETKSAETFTDYTQEKKSYQTNLSEIFDRLKTELVDLHSHIEKQDIRL